MSIMKYTANHPRNALIEVLRFAFSIIIVLFHTGFLVKGRELTDGNVFFKGGSCAVEFFFVLSGFLMAKSIASKKPLQNASEIAEETFGYVFSKMRRLWPHILLSITIILLLEVIFGRLSPGGAVIKVWNNVSELFFIQMSGFEYGTINGHLWYVSAMILAMWVLYPVARSAPVLFNLVIAPVIGIFIVGWMIQSIGGVGRPFGKTGFLFNGMFRAFAEIALGCFCYALAERIKTASRVCRPVLAGLILISLVMSMFWMWNPFGGSAFHLLGLFSVIVVCSFAVTGDGCGRSRKCAAICGWLGSLSVPVYIHQNWAIKLGGFLYPSITSFDLYLKVTVLIVAVVTCFSAVIHFLGGYCRSRMGSNAARSV